MLEPSDVRDYLRQKAATIAPGDVKALLSGAAKARQRVGREGDEHRMLQRQVDVALQMLEDHVARRCAQIPYHTVAVLTVGLLYVLEAVDVIPDWIPRIGLSDDALVLELAFEMAAPGVKRYCEWKSIPLADVLPLRQRAAGRKG